MDGNVSENAKTKLREIADARGISVAHLAGGMIEKNPDKEAPRRGVRKLSDMAGIFYGGDENTAEQAPEILRAESGENSRGSN